MFELIVRAEFASAHRLREYPGDCEKLHGHSWRVEVRVSAKELDPLGMVCDFRDLKRRIRRVVGALDHHYLNEVPPFDALNPTTENVSKHLYQTLRHELPDGIAIVSVTTWESEDCGATYTGNDQ